MKQKFDYKNDKNEFTKEMLNDTLKRRSWFNVIRRICQA